MELITKLDRVKVTIAGNVGTIPADTYPTEYYNQERIQKCLDRIEAINDECENKVERLYAKKDKEVELYNRVILQEQSKPTKEEV